LKFSIYFPPKENYKGRFFQPISAISGSETWSFRHLSLTLIFLIWENLLLNPAHSSLKAIKGAKMLYPGKDATIPGYRASAAVARFAREMAQKEYGTHRTYGYVYGGSGGASKAQACVENTVGIWQGAVLFISASPIAIPNVFTVSAHAMRLLGNNYSRIVDAVDPGGSGNMYDGFDEEQKQALREVNPMSLAPQSWFRYLRTSLSYTAVFAQLLDGVYRLDPNYFTDFWTKPGYLGANTTKSLLKARIQHTTTIKRMLTAKQLAAIGLDFYPMPDNIKNETDAAPVAIQLASYPEGDLSGATIKLTSGPAAGNWVYTLVMYKKIAVITYGENNSPNLGKMKQGDQVLVDDSIYLASQTYHRHQNPGQEYLVWSQFRKADRSDMYPQRPSRRSLQ
jgi:hypothetical protein